MKRIILSAGIVCLFAACAAVDAPVQTSSTLANGVDAVTRNPAPKPQASPPAQSASVPEPGLEQVIDPAIDPASARSYNATWEDGGFRHRSVMFPHIIDGCKVMIQSRRTLDYVAGSQGEFFEREGPDCNCDLVIDGFEDVFAQLNDEYKTPRMYSVCAGPGVDGVTRQLEIMRESLKEQRNFDKMKNVEGF